MMCRYNTIDSFSLTTISFLMKKYSYRQGLKVDMSILVDLDSIHNKLSSDYSLNLCFPRDFPHIDGQSFS